MAVNDKLRSIASKCYQVKHLQSFASDARDDLLVAHDPFSQGSRPTLEFFLKIARFEKKFGSRFLSSALCS
jgi:hypothetical protein